jgi:phage shock protein A
MIDEHLEELLSEALRKRDAYKQYATDYKNKLDKLVVECETLKVRIEGLQNEIKSLNATIEDLEVGNKFLLKAMRKQKS